MVKNKEIEEIKMKIIPVLKEYRVTRAGIFGSYARGEQKKDSDIDILKVFKEIVEELPFLTLQTKKDCYTNPDDFWIKYNSYTQIRFDDGLRSIKREIVLSKILA